MKPLVLPRLRDRLPSLRRERDTAILDAPRLRLGDYFTLRPYGRSLMTPAVSVWLISAWSVILLMASIEGFVWGAVGASLVPSASPWLAAPVALFMFLLMFSIIWIVDSSLIMSERPTLRLGRSQGAEPRGLGHSTRWLIGLLVRVAIVAISLYVTAPFIEKLIRADDIAAWHQDRVEQYYKDRDATLQAQVQARVAQLDAGLAARIDALEQEIDRLGTSLAADRARRRDIEAEFAPQIEVLTRDLAEARRRVGDEVLGRDGRPEGYGPEARKWDARVQLLEEELAQVQAQREQRLAGVQQAIDAQQQRIAERADALQQVRAEQAALLGRVREEVAAEQPPPAPPKLTFAARSKGLNALRNSPDEAGVPHFETVEGFAQAALGILFFALIALKLFEPPAVRAYYTEQLQLQYRKYLEGGLAEVPGFGQHADPVRRLSPLEFARRWTFYDRDPEGYFAQISDLAQAEARVQQVLSEQHYELELLQRQRDDIDQRLALEQRRRDAELAAYERELALKLDETGKRLAGETDAEIERLEAGRAEARRTHELEMERLQQRFEAERQRLEEALAQERAKWDRERAMAEEELRRQAQVFADKRRQAREQEQQRRAAQDDWRRLRELELQQTAMDSERTHARAARQQRIEETRALLRDERAAQTERRGELARLRGELAGNAGGLTEARAELGQLDAGLARETDRMAALEQEAAASAARLDSTRALLPDPRQRARQRWNRRRRRHQRALTAPGPCCPTPGSAHAAVPSAPSSGCKRPWPSWQAAGGRSKARLPGWSGSRRT